tara:strand:+ start:287 stop:421 length:135 start_codon:yes stop_codon:yes gene_type:complete
MAGFRKYIMQKKTLSVEGFQKLIFSNPLLLKEEMLLLAREADHT